MSVQKWVLVAIFLVLVAPTGMASYWGGVAPTLAPLAAIVLAAGILHLVARHLAPSARRRRPPVTTL
jgi:membrane protein YdbS with pleckstrin-like domain